jgi:hypothetical protein
MIAKSKTGSPRSRVSRGIWARARRGRAGTKWRPLRCVSRVDSHRSGDDECNGLRLNFPIAEYRRSAARRQLAGAFVEERGELHRGESDPKPETARRRRCHRKGRSNEEIVHALYWTESTFGLKQHTLAYLRSKRRRVDIAGRPPSVVVCHSCGNPARSCQQCPVIMFARLGCRR